MACLKLLDEEVIAEATNIDLILAYVGLLPHDLVFPESRLHPWMCLLMWRPLCVLLKQPPAAEGSAA
jgi:hypothetical protein